MEKLKAQFSQILPYFMVTLMFYYGGPLFMINDEVSVFIMGVVLPIGSMLIGFVVGLREGFKPLYSLLCLLAFFFLGILLFGCRSPALGLLAFAHE